MGKLRIKVVTPERVVFEDEMDSVTTMTEMGEITVLPGHIPLVAALRAGEMRLKKGSDEELLATSTGFIEIRQNNEVIVLADTAERAEELEIAKIEAARERAKALLEEKRQADDVSFADAAAALERELARYRVAMKRKYRKAGPTPTAQE